MRILKRRIFLTLFIISICSISTKAYSQDLSGTDLNYTKDIPSNALSKAEKINVLFFNPGAEDDPGVWSHVSKFMKAAADDLKMEIEILYADRDHLLMYEQAELVAKRSNPPDYAIIVNEKLMGARMLLALQSVNTKVIVMHNDISLEQRDIIGNEREKLSNWIGTIITDEYLAGYKEIQRLCELSREEPRIIAITGDITTPVSEIRTKGMKDFINQLNHGELLQVVYGNWSFEDGREKAMGLLERYGNTNIIWTANDSMALGAFSAVLEKKLEKKVIVGGLGGFPDSLTSIVNNELKVTVGGHSMIGAWALVMIYDYEHDMDFVSEIGLSYKVDHLIVIDNSTEASRFRELIIEHPEKIDFAHFSKFLNPGLENYDFNFGHILKTYNN